MGYLIKPVRRENPTALVEVPETVAKELEELYTYLQEHPKECGLVTFDTADEVKAFTAQAKSWAQTRQSGTLNFRKLPSPGLGDKSFRFSITPVEAAKPAEEPAAEETAAEAAAPEPAKATAKK